MSKNITQLALKFSKLISLGEPTPEELDTITGKNVPQRVLLSNEVISSLSQLVDKLTVLGATQPAADIKAGFKKLMAHGISASDGVMVFTGYDLEPMLVAVHKAFLFLQETKASTDDIGKATDIYSALSQLSVSKAPQKPALQTPVISKRLDVEQVQRRLTHLGYPLTPDGKLGKLTRAGLKWFRDHNASVSHLDDEATIDAILEGQYEESKASIPVTEHRPGESTWGDSGWRNDSVLSEPTEASKLADRFEKLGSELPIVNIDQPWWGKSSMFAVSITTVDPKMNRTAMLSFMHQLESSPYRAMIKYVQDHRDDGRLLIAFREPMSKEKVLEICNSLSLSFSRHDDDKFFAGGDDELIVTDIDVESYSVYPVKETLDFTIVAKSSDDALALVDELKRFARIKDTQAQENVIQVTFKESSSVSELRAMCEKLSRLYKSINQIDIDSLTISER